MIKKAVYAGSFDCYTKGHHDIVRIASEIFDEVHILVSNNSSKIRRFPADRMADAIRMSVAEDKLKNCTVALCNGFVADYCIEQDIRYLVRGLRNGLDYFYEENISNANKMVAPYMETVYLRAPHACISSSIVREMYEYEKDISTLIPKPVLDLLLSYRLET